MTKQEEIREGIKGIIASYHNQVPFADEVPEILRYLHSQGCVIKVDRKLTYYAGLNRFVERGTDKDVEVSAVEPLIKEKK